MSKTVSIVWYDHHYAVLQFTWNIKDYTISTNYVETIIKINYVQFIFHTAYYCCVHENGLETVKTMGSRQRFKAVTILPKTNSACIFCTRVCAWSHGLSWSVTLYFGIVVREQLEYDLRSDRRTEMRRYNSVLHKRFRQQWQYAVSISVGIYFIFIFYV